MRCQRGARLAIRCGASVRPVNSCFSAPTHFMPFGSVCICKLTLSLFLCCCVNTHLLQNPNWLMGHWESIVQHNHRLPGHAKQGTLSMAARKHEGSVQSIKSILPYRSDICRQTKINIPFHFLLCTTKWMRASLEAKPDWLLQSWQPRPTLCRRGETTSDLNPEEGEQSLRTQSHVLLCRTRHICRLTNSCSVDRQTYPGTIIHQARLHSVSHNV